MQRYQFHQQSQKLDTLYRPRVSNEQGFIGTDNYLDAGLICVHERDEFFLSHGGIDSCFRYLTKILHLNHFLQKKFWPLLKSIQNLGEQSVVWRFSEILYNQKFAIAQPIKVKLGFSSLVLTAQQLTGYALLLTKKYY